MQVHGTQNARPGEGLEDTAKDVSINISRCSGCEAIAVAAIELKKGEPIIRYSNRLQGLVSEPDVAGHKVSEIDQKRALLCSRTGDFDVTPETFIDIEYDYDKAISRLIVRETRLAEKETGTAQALMTQTEKDSSMCHTVQSRHNSMD